VGEIDVTVGGAAEYTENMAAAEVCNVSELKTVTENAAGVVIRLFGMTLCNVVAFTNVVGSDSPLTRTTEELLKLLPLTVIETEADPTGATLGDID